MSTFDKYPNLYRLGIVGILLLLLTLAFTNFYRNSNATTDENWFRNSPAKIYLCQSLPGFRIETVTGADPSKSHDIFTLDSAQVGDLLVSIFNQKLNDKNRLAEMLQTLSRDSVIYLQVFRPPENRYLQFKIPAIAISERFFRQIPKTVYVTGVVAGGASDRAGMKLGDLIYQIDGQSFSNANEADRIMRKVAPGKAITYDIIRNCQELVLHVTLAKLGIQIGDLIVFLCGLSYFVVGAFIALKRPQIKAARLLGLAFILVGFFFAALVNQFPHNYDFFAKFRLVVVTICLFGGLALWIVSRFYFPKELSMLSRQHWIAIAPYAFIFIILLLYFLSLFTPALAFFWLGFYAADLILFGGIVLLLLYSSLVHFYYRKFKSQESKTLARPLAIMDFFVGIAGLNLGFAMAFKGVHFAFQFLLLLFFFTPLVYLYTIGHYRLLDISLRIRRSIQYSILSWLWSLILIGIAFFLMVFLANFELRIPYLHFSGNVIQVFEHGSPLKGSAYQDKLALMALALGLVFLVWKIARLGQRYIDKKYHRARYDYRRAASELADVMATKLQLDDLAYGIVKELAELMQLKHVGVFFYNNAQVCCCREASGFKTGAWQKLCQIIDQEFVRILQQHQSDSLFSVDYLPATVKEHFIANGIQFIVPIRSRDKLIGSLIVGEKLSESAFQQEDLAFLSAVTRQASIAIENAFLYQELAEQERLKYELEIARRIQLASLPQQTPEIEGLDISGVSIPALEVGGDYFDYLNGMTNSLTVIVGDVSGKGTSAALYMSKIQGIMRSLHDFGLSPKELFIRANKLLCHDLEKTAFVTAIGAEFDHHDKKVVVARAGHLPLFYFRANDRLVIKITPKGVGLGLDKAGIYDTSLEEVIINFCSGDVFLFVTDGVTEARGSDGKEFGEDRLVSLLAAQASDTAAHIREQIVSEVNRFVVGRSHHDDLTVVVVKVKDS